MSRAMILRALVLLPFIPALAHAEEVRAHYTTYAAGLTVLRTEAALAIEPKRYSLQLDYQTAGTFGFFNHAQFSNRGEGVWDAGRAQPVRVTSHGSVHGDPHVTAIDYKDGQPLVRELTPKEEDREKVPPEQMRGTLDTLGAVAQLIRQVNTTGRCDMAIRTFDGRRVSALRAWTVGMDTLPHSDTSIYAGPALHCEFEGHLLAGFKTDESRDRQAKPQHGGAWFAALKPGAMQVPVRMTFVTPWFGEATMLVDAVH